MEKWNEVFHQLVYNNNDKTYCSCHTIHIYIVTLFKNNIFVHTIFVLDNLSSIYHVIFMLYY